MKRGANWALVFFLAAGAVQAKVNFTGDWKLNVSRSDFGQAPALSGMTMKNTHEDPSFKCLAKVMTDGGEIVYDLTFSTDGKESVNQADSMEMKTTAVWEGDTLIMNTKGQAGGGEITFRDKWSLSDGGKTLTLLRHIVTGGGERDLKMVLEKQ